MIPVPSGGYGWRRGAMQDLARWLEKLGQDEKAVVLDLVNPVVPAANSSRPVWEWSPTQSAGFGRTKPAPFDVGTTMLLLFDSQRPYL